MNSNKTVPKIMLVEKPWAEICSIVFLSPTGSCLETPEKRGWTHLAEHMILLGSEKYPIEKYSPEFDKFALQVNASTNLESFALFATGLTENFSDEVVSTLTDLFLSPAFDEMKLEKEKSVVLEEIEMQKSNYLKALWQKTLDTLYPTSPVTNHPLGNKEAIASATAGDLREFYANLLKNYGFSVVIVGDNRIHSIAKKIEKLIEAKKIAIDLQEKPLVTSVREQVSTVLNIHLPIPQPKIQIGYFTEKPSLAKSVSLSMLAVFLGSGKNAYLRKKLRREHGLAYNISATWYSVGDVCAFLISTSSTKSDEVIKLITTELQFISHALTSEVFENVKSQYLNMTQMHNANTLNEAQYVANFLAQYDEYVDRNRFVSLVKDVTQSDMVELIAELFTQEKCIITVGSQEKSE